MARRVEERLVVTTRNGHSATHAMPSVLRAAVFIGLLSFVALSAFAADPRRAAEPSNGSPFGMHPAYAFGLPDPYAAAREAGVTWTRDAAAPYLFWALVDPHRTGDPNQMVWAGLATGQEGQIVPFDYDEGIGRAVSSGLSVVWNIAVEPVAMGFSRPGSWLPVDEAAYVEFVKAAVARYPGVRVWQVANEPNLGAGRGFTGFAAFHELTYHAIKAADPGATVLLAGVGGGGSVRTLTDDAFYDPLLDALNGCCVDVFDIHFYGDPVGGTTTSSPSGDHMVGYQDFETAARHYREHLDARGFSATRIWTTENGTYSGTISMAPGVTFTATEAEQARDLPKRWVVALASGVEKLFWAWGMTEGFGLWDDDLFDHTGLLYNGRGGPPGTPKLAYWAYWQMTRQLDGCRWAQMSRIETSVANTRAYRCPLEGGGEVVVAWWDTFLVTGWVPGSTMEITVPWSGGSAVTRAAVPDAAAGADVTDPAAAFATASLTPSGGMLTLTLGADPVYVRPEASPVGGTARAPDLPRADLRDERRQERRWIVPASVIGAAAAAAGVAAWYARRRQR